MGDINHCHVVCGESAIDQNNHYLYIRAYNIVTDSFSVGHLTTADSMTYINHQEHPIIIEFAKGRLPIGVLLDYLEDYAESICLNKLNKQTIDESLSLFSNDSLAVVRECYKNKLWSTYKELQ